MNSKWQNIAYSGREVGRRSQSICARTHVCVSAFLILAVLMGGSTAFGQTEKSSSPKREGPVTVTDSTARVDNIPAAVSPGQTTPHSSGVGEQTAPRRSSLRREEPFAYSSRGRRDPFRPLIKEGKANEDIKTDLLRVDGAVLTGVVWSGGEYLAMVRDKDGNNFFLREGDSVFRGKIVTVTQTKAVFQLVEFGEVERVTLTVRAGENTKDNK
jgi:hypothetical protein